MKDKNIIHQADNDLNKFKQQLLEGIKAGKPLSGKYGLLTPLLKEVIEASLEGELDAHLQEAHSNNINNRRNGYTSKEISSESGTFNLSTPRDRNSSFEPQIVKKRQTVLNEAMDQKILSLFSSGMGYIEISNHIADMYDVDVSTSTISAITDRLMPKINEWRARPLDSTYPVVFLDGMFFKVRDGGKVVTKVLYNILGINQAGIKEILGFYIAESEGANFWLGVLNDLRERGVKDILIACIDGLTGFPQAIATIFPKTEVQLCVVHQIRSSLKYVVSKEQKQFLADLKLVYTAANKDLSEIRLNIDMNYILIYSVIIIIIQLERGAVMKKFDRLLIQLESYVDSALDLADFGLKQEQVDVLVKKINEIPTIKILILKHNSLGDDCISVLSKLTNIESLDISYNNFTKIGLDTLEKQKKNTLHVYADHNNTKTLFFSEQQEQVPTLNYSQTSDDYTINSYAGELFREALIKLSEIPLSKTDKQLVAKKFIDMLNSNEEVFESEKEEEPTLKVKMGKLAVM